MVIKESDFILKSIGSELFDLKLLLGRKKKKDGTEEIEEAVVRGCTLFSALRRIINNRIKAKNTDGAIDMKKLRDDFIRESEYFSKLFTPNE